MPAACLVRSPVLHCCTGNACMVEHSILWRLHHAPQPLIMRPLDQQRGGTECKGRDAILQRLHHCSHRPAFHRPSGQSRWRRHEHRVAVHKSRRHYTTKAPPLQPQATFHRPRVRFSRGGTENAKAEMLYYERLTMQPRPPSIDPGSGQQRGGKENAKAETLCYEGFTHCSHRPLP